MAKPTVFFYVQHLLGIGHVFRATRIARALARAGCKTHLIWGGTRLPDIDMNGLIEHYLPPVRAGDASFSDLVHPDGSAFTQDEKDNRCRQLLGLFDEISPDILITEAFPFGRRQMRFELVPLMERAAYAKSPVLKVSSIRDIMQEGRREKRVIESLDAVKNWFDLVLVHGDPKLIAIEDTLQGAEAIADKVRYTGLVLPDPPSSDSGSNGQPVDVLVSAGGGAVGLGLMQAAIDARQYSTKYQGDWMLVTGSELPDADHDALAERASKHVKVVRFLPNIVEAMRAAKVSVSRSGYNTVGDLLRAQVASVLVPFTGGRETEQLRRAEIMDARGGATLLRPEDLTPQSLAAAVDRALPPKFDPGALDLNGAENAATLLIEAHQRFAG